MTLVEQSLTSFTSINVNNEFSSWSSLTTYTLGQNVTKGGKSYISLLSSNLNNDPELDTGEWFNCGVDNKTACLQLYSSDKTICDSTTITSGTAYNLTITINVSLCNMVVLVGAEGSHLKIEEKDGASAIINTINVNIDETQKYTAVNYAYTPNSSAVYATITISEKTVGGYSALKYLIGGSSMYLGDTLYNPSIKVGGTAMVYSSPNLITYIDKENVGNIYDFDIQFPSSSIMTVQRNAKEMKHVLAGFVLDTSIDSIYENLCFCGYIDSDFNILLRNGTKTRATVEVKEV